jgi:hypothetical protein
VQCPDFYKGRFRLRNKLKMLISENERFRQKRSTLMRDLHQTNALILEEKSVFNEKEPPNLFSSKTS